MSWYTYRTVYGIKYPSASLIVNATERVTGRKARVLQMEEIGCKSQTFLSFCLLSSISSCISPLVLVVWASLTSIVRVSIEIRVVWGRTETEVVWTSTWAVWISVWVFTEAKATWISEFLPGPRQPFLGGRGEERGGSLTFSLLCLESWVWG